MKSVYRMEELSEGLKYLDDQSEESYIQKKGEYLKLEYNSTQNVYNSQVDELIKEC